MQQASSSRFPARSPRIVVLGNIGSGKTTMSMHISDALGIPHVELDALQWEPDWTSAAPETFRHRVDQATSTELWVVDGNYSVVRDIVWPRATVIAWLDYPLGLSLWRVLRRSVVRSVRGTELWKGTASRSGGSSPPGISCCCGRSPAMDVAEIRS